jgi:hypothetical protein
MIILSLSIYYCGPKQDEVERIIEDGVEVVINHLEPYKIDGEFSTLTLIEEFAIDTEKNDVAAIGLTDLAHFDIDSEGSIYCFDETSNKNFIFKFDKNGRFITSFGTKGQGPGELNRPYHLGLNEQEQIVVTDYLARKLLFYDKQGDFIKAIALNFMAISAHPYNPVSVPEEYKKERLNGIKFQETKDATYFPESFPPFQGIFADDTDRLYVMTFEKDAETDEYIFDLFNPDGFYVGRNTINVMFRNSVLAKVKDNHLYCVSEKDSGYKELTVYRMNWE